MIELTVALPLYKGKDIAWLALESLCRQKDVNFKWELLIVEEKEDCYGLEKIKEYVSRLKQVGCVRLDYVPLDRWVPLSDKWKHLATMASDTSECFLLQAADCYAQPYRLKETRDLFKKDKEIDWVQSEEGLFYDIYHKKGAIFDHSLCFISTGQGHKQHKCALNMAIKTSLIKKLFQARGVHAMRGVDGFLFRTLASLKGSSLKVEWNRSNNWKLGFDTDGLNNISWDRTFYIRDGRPPFKKLPDGEKVEDYIPADILSKLDDCYTAAKTNTLLHPNQQMPYG